MRIVETVFFVRRLGLVFATASLLVVSAHAGAQPAAPQALPHIAQRVAGLQPLPGFLPLYWDVRTGHLLMEISRLDAELLYQISLAAGLGSNPVGLDRGQMGRTSVVRFERVGPRVLLVAANYRYRALSEDAAERRAVADSFATAVLWGFPVEAEDAGRVLVDATAFFLRDAHGVIDRLRAVKQGRYRLEESRSAIYLPRTKAFPRNTEVEAILTFTTDEDPGPLVEQTAADPRAVTMREHHSFVELPGPGYVPRRFDPRVGTTALDFYDYASPITEPVEKRWIVRHRLQKKDPAAARSEVVQPIVYYVDPGAPEPIRQALIDGASWWNQAFEAAGFLHAFEIKVLPAGADPMDLRYNTINWVHRSTRGWSYGDAVVDPRTGEILKGNVLLGSLRVRQDVLIGTGLEAPYSSRGEGESPAVAGQGRSWPAPWSSRSVGPSRRECDAGAIPDISYLAEADSAADITALALARIRQLAAHEVGHALGFEHNFAASTYGRASVMDYPAPLVTIRDGRLDLSNAYATGIGRYDEFAVRYAYSQFATGTDEDAALAGIVREGLADGLLFIDDDDARPPGAAHPLASLWDNGADAPAALREQLAVRRVALDRFGVGTLTERLPLSVLEARLVPVYLYHRFQLQAALKWVGGLYFTYAVKQEGSAAPSTVRRIVAPSDQRRALTAVLDTLSPEVLDVPQRILDLLPPPSPGFAGRTIELFPRATGPAFDPVSAAVTAADLAVSGLLEPARAARLERFHAEDPQAPGFDEVLRALVAKTWGGGTSPSHAPAGPIRAIDEGVQTLTVTRLVELAGRDDASPPVRHEAAAALKRLAARLAGRTDAHGAGTRDDIERFLARPDATRRATPPPTVPPGEPIG